MQLAPELIALLMLGGVFILVMTGFPIAFVIGSVAFLVGILVFGPNTTFHILFTRFYDLSLNYPYLAVPLFTFMGVVLENSGITNDLYASLYDALGRVRGGLAIVTVIFGTILAACLGVIAASVTILTLMSLGPMIKRGYDKGLASGVIVASGTLGILIPPSIMLIVYAPQAGLSIGQMFMGAIFPGLLLSGLYILYVIIRTNLNPKLGPPIPKDQMTPFTPAKLGRLLKAVLPPVVLIAAVMGTIFSGIAPPTEAAAVGCTATILLSVVYRKFSWKMILKASIDTLKVSSFVVFIAAMSYAFVGIFMNAGAGNVVADLILNVPGGKWASFAVVMLIVFALGMFIEWIGIVFIVVPIFSIIFAKLGFDPLWAGMMVVVNLQMAFMTPPMAMSIFVLKGTAPKEYEISMGDIIRGVLPFVGLVGFALIIMVIFPGIITWLPNLMYHSVR